MSNRGEPPLHWDGLASVNDAVANVCPVKPVMSAPAAAGVSVVHFFSRWSTPLLYVLTVHVPVGSNGAITSAAPAGPAAARAQAAIAAMMSLFIRPPLIRSLPTVCPP